MSDSPKRFFQLGASRQPADIVGWRHEQPVTAGALFSRMQAWCDVVKAFRGDNMALYLSDTLEFIAALFAALHEGKRVFLPANALFGTCESLARDVDAFMGEFPPAFSPLFPEDTGIKRQTEPVTFILPSTASLVIYTSGSTGDAQAIPKRISQFLTEVAILEKCFTPLSRQTEIAATVSHQHIYGLLFKVFWPLVTEKPIHAASYRFPEELTALASTRKLTLISSPAHLKRFTESTDWQQKAHHIQAVFSSGGPLERETALKNRALLGTAPVEIYGSSETGGIAWRQRQEDGDESWQPLPEVKWQIDPEEQVLEVHSPYLYDNNWFRMADRATGTNNNRFLLGGRIDRIVKIEEKRVSLTALEKALTDSPLVNAVRVIPVDMEGSRQRLAAFVVLSPEGKAALHQSGKLDTNRHFRDLLAPLFEQVALPKIWRYLDDLPVNMQGKTTYAELQATLDNDPRPVEARKKPDVQIVEKTDNHLLVRLTLTEDLLYFQGHFPEAPLLPGVVQVDWALMFGREHFDLPKVFGGIQALKFQQVMAPGDMVNLELAYDGAKSSLAFRYFSEEKQYASGKIAFLFLLSPDDTVSA